MNIPAITGATPIQSPEKSNIPEELLEGALIGAADVDIIDEEDKNPEDVVEGALTGAAGAMDELMDKAKENEAEKSGDNGNNESGFMTFLKMLLGIPTYVK